MLPSHNEVLFLGLWSSLQLINTPLITEFQVIIYTHVEIQANPPTVTELKAEAPSAVHNKTGLHLWKVSTVPVYYLIQNKRLYWNNCVYCIYYKLYILQAGAKSEYQKWHLSNKDGLQCARPVWKPKQLRDEGCGRTVGIIPRKDASFITCFSKGHSASSFMKGNEIHEWVVQEKKYISVSTKWSRR